MATTQPGGLYLTPGGAYVDANGQPVEAPEPGENQTDTAGTSETDAAEALAAENAALRARLAEAEAKAAAAALAPDAVNDTARKATDVPAKNTGPEETEKATKGSKTST